MGCFRDCVRESDPRCNPLSWEGDSESGSKSQNALGLGVSRDSSLLASWFWAPSDFFFASGRFSVVQLATEGCTQKVHDQVSVQCLGVLSCNCFVSTRGKEGLRLWVLKAFILESILRALHT